jgi:predicted ribosomally synthesized peptide with SipW-like signal peptide
MKKFFTKRNSLIAGLVLLAILVSATAFAWFSDQEKSSGNSFTSGTLDLTVDGQNGPSVVHLTRTNMYPSNPWSHSWGGQWVLKNTGTLPGKFDVTVKNIVNSENGINDPEMKAGDTTADVGELGSLMYAKFSENYYGITPYMGWTGSGVFNPFNSIEDQTVQGIVLQPGDSIVVYLDMEWDSHAGLTDNTAQGDSLAFDVVFNLVQVH